MHFLMYALPHRQSSVFTGPSTLKTICGAGEPKYQLAGEKIFGVFPFQGRAQTGTVKPFFILNMEQKPLQRVSNSDSVQKLDKAGLRLSFAALRRP